jgi:hypothetical protein
MTINPKNLSNTLEWERVMKSVFISIFKSMQMNITFVAIKNDIKPNVCIFQTPM